MRLNGWQRLWVVLTVLWSMWVGFLSWQTWPGRVVPDGFVPDDKRFIGYDAQGREVFEDQKPLAQQGKLTASDFAAEPRKIIGYDLDGTPRSAPSGRKVIGVETDGTPIYAQPTPDESKKAQLAYRAAKVSAVERAAALWLLPPGLVYGLGWSVGWVYRGFRRSGPRKDQPDRRSM